jgi:hypothetical protein
MAPPVVSDAPFESLTTGAQATTPWLGIQTPHPHPVDAPTLPIEMPHPHRGRERCSLPIVLSCSSLLLGRTDQHHIIITVINIAKMQASAQRFVFAIPKVSSRRF